MHYIKLHTVEYFIYCKTKINKNFRQTFYENKNKSKNFYMRDLRNMIQSLSKEISRYLT